MFHVKLLVIRIMIGSIRIIMLCVVIPMAGVFLNAGVMYVDQLPAEPGSGWDGVDGHNYTSMIDDGYGYVSIKAAIGASMPGDIIYVREGIYYENTITFPRSGTAEHPIVVSSYENENVIIDGQQDIDSDGLIFGFSDVHYITIDGLKVTGFGTDFWGGGFYFGGRDSCSNIMVQNCEIYSTDASRNTDNPSLIVFYSSDRCSVVNSRIYSLNNPSAIQISGIKVWKDNTNVLVENCEFYGLFGKAFDNKHGIPGQNIVVRNNYFHQCSHYEGAIHINANNARIENNIIAYCRTGIMLYHEAGSAGGSGSTLNHNTIFECSSGIVLCDTNSPMLFDVVTTNNVIVNSGNEFREYNIAPYADAYAHRHTSDYNCFSNAGSERTIREHGTNYTLNSWQAHSGQDSHSIALFPTFEGGDNPETANGFELAPGSPGKNGASDGSDMGADVSLVGVRGNLSPVLSTIGNRSVPAGQQVQISVNASDADGDPLNFSATGGER